LRALAADPELGQALAASGLETIRARHTCEHRARELLAIVAEVNQDPLASGDVVKLIGDSA
jgi:spore maturation protein CgeB